MANWSPGVAALVAAAAGVVGLPDGDAVTLRGVASVHDVGRVGVPNGIWDGPGPLSADQWEGSASTPISASGSCGAARCWPA